MKVIETVSERNQIPDFSKGCNLYIDELKAIYESEKQLNLTLPKMIDEAETPEIADGLIVHLKFTQEHLLRLESFFISIEENIKL